MKPGSATMARLGRIWPLLVALVPAILLLRMILRWSLPVPYADTWSYVGEYQAWMAGRFPWQEWLAKEGDHPSAVPRAITFAVLHWFGGDMRLLTFLNWLCSAVVAACVLVLSRPLWRHNPATGAILSICGSLTIFNAAQGGVWTWDFMHGIFFAGAVLALGVLLLAPGKLDRWRIAAIMVLNVVSIFTYGGGFLFGVVLTPLLWSAMKDARLSRKITLCAAWLVFTGMMTVLALKGFGNAGYTMDREVTAADIFGRPLTRIHFILILLGHMMGMGTVAEPFVLSAVFGGVLLLVFLACTVFVIRRRDDGALVSAALPWMAFCLYGLAYCYLVSVGRMRDSFADEDALGERVMAERFISISRFFVMGVVFLAAVIVQHGGARGVLPRLLKASAAPAITLFIALQCVNWAAGARLMRMEHMLMKQERAMLSFGQHVKLDPMRLWMRKLKYHTVEYAKKLSDMGKLQGVRFAPDNRLGTLKCKPELSARRASFDPPDRMEDGRWQLSGFCALGNRELAFVPDLLLITAQPDGGEERLVTVIAPRLPETFFDRETQRRKYIDHHHAWSWMLETAQLPAGASTLRAYAFDGDEWSVAPVRGNRRIENPMQH